MGWFTVMGSMVLTLFLTGATLVSAPESPVADAARAFRPRILYPYHFGETDTSELVRLLAGEEGIEVRVRGEMR